MQKIPLQHKHLNKKTYLRFLTGNTMVSITLSVPEKTRKLMKTFPEMNWSGFIRKQIEEKVKSLAKTETLLEQLEEEKEITNWSLQAQKEIRTKRLKELKKQGLL